MSNVKVAVRTRPLSKREVDKGSKFIVDITGDTLSLTNTKVDSLSEYGDSREKVKHFAFDYCYNSYDQPQKPIYASQEVLFQDLGTEVLQAAFEGYNACVFAYGQTSTGKTYTMMGQPGEVGLIPRICEGLFARVDDYGTEQITFRVDISYLEIYNERVRDLLNPKHSDKSTLKVREHPKEGPYVQDLSRHLVKDNPEIQSLLEKGNDLRVTAATHMHDRSSRSHAIITITFTQASIVDDLPSEIVSKIHLVDLAGSERADTSVKAGYKGRLKEGANINKSLVTLGNVIKSLAEKSLLSWSTESMTSVHNTSGTSEIMTSPHGSPRKQRTFYIPYRDSVLTWLLKDSLGGNSKTIMIATITPSSHYYSESLSTLRYAQRAKSIINKPKINEDPNVTMIREMKREIERLRQMLATAQMQSSQQNEIVFIVPIKRKKHDSEADTQAGPLMSLQESGPNTFLFEKIQENEDKANQLTQTWLDKWQETQDILDESDLSIRRPLGRRASSQGVIVDSQLPHLIGMDDDILSTGVIIYHLREGKTRIGREDAKREQDIGLCGPGVQREHCIIKNVMGTVTIYPNRGALCAVNGIDLKEPQKLTQGDVILIGKTHMFRFNHPEEAAKLREHRRVQSLSGSTSSISEFGPEGCSTPNLLSPSEVTSPGAPARSQMRMFSTSRSSSTMDLCGEPSSPTEDDGLEATRRELEEVREAQRQTEDHFHDKEDVAYRLHELHRAEIEEDKSRLVLRIEEAQADRVRAEEEMIAARQHLEEEREEHAMMLQNELEKLKTIQDKQNLQYSGKSDEVGEIPADTDEGSPVDTTFRVRKNSLEGKMKDLVQAELMQKWSERETEFGLSRHEEELEDEFEQTQEQILLHQQKILEIEDSYKAADVSHYEEIAKKVKELNALQRKEEQLEMFLEEKHDLLKVKAYKPQPLRGACSAELLTETADAYAQKLSGRRGSEGDLPASGYMFAAESSISLDNASPESSESLNEKQRKKQQSRMSSNNSLSGESSEGLGKSRDNLSKKISQRAQNVTDRLYKAPPNKPRAEKNIKTAVALPKSSLKSFAKDSNKAKSQPLVTHQPSLKQKGALKGSDQELWKKNSSVKLQSKGVSIKPPKAVTATKKTSPMKAFDPLSPKLLNALAQKRSISETVLSSARLPFRAAGFRLRQVSSASSLASVPEDDSEHASSVEDTATQSETDIRTAVVLRKKSRKLSPEEAYKRHSAPVGDKLAAYKQFMNPGRSLMRSRVGLAPDSSCSGEDSSQTKALWVDHHEPMQTDSSEADLHKQISSTESRSDSEEDFYSAAGSSSCIPVIVITDSETDHHMVDSSDEATFQDQAQSLQSETEDTISMDSSTVTIASTVIENPDYISCSDDERNVSGDTGVPYVKPQEMSTKAGKKRDHEHIPETSKTDEAKRPKQDVCDQPSQPPIQEISTESTVEKAETECVLPQSTEQSFSGDSLDGNEPLKEPTSGGIIDLEEASFEDSLECPKQNPVPITDLEMVETSATHITTSVAEPEQGDSDFSLDSIQDAKDKLETLQEVLQQLKPKSSTKSSAGTKRTRQRAQLRHNPSQDSDASEHLSDDSLGSGTCSKPSSRPSSASKRRRRPQTKTQDPPVKKSKGMMSSEEYVTSDSDGVYSDDSLTFSDNRISKPSDQNNQNSSDRTTEEIANISSSIQQLTDNLQNSEPTIECLCEDESKIMPEESSDTIGADQDTSKRLPDATTVSSENLSESKISDSLARSKLGKLSRSTTTLTTFDGDSESSDNKDTDKKHNFVIHKDELNVVYNVQRTEYNALGLRPLQYTYPTQAKVFTVEQPLQQFPESIDITLTETKFTQKRDKLNTTHTEQVIFKMPFNDNIVFDGDSHITERVHNSAHETEYCQLTDGDSTSRENSVEKTFKEENSKSYIQPGVPQEEKQAVSTDMTHNLSSIDKSMDKTTSPVFNVHASSISGHTVPITFSAVQDNENSDTNTNNSVVNDKPTRDESPKNIQTSTSTTTSLDEYMNNLPAPQVLVTAIQDLVDGSPTDQNVNISDQQLHLPVLILGQSYAEKNTGSECIDNAIPTIYVGQTKSDSKSTPSLENDKSVLIPLGLNLIRDTLATDNVVPVLKSICDTVSKNVVSGNQTQDLQSSGGITEDKVHQPMNIDTMKLTGSELSSEDEDISQSVIIVNGQPYLNFRRLDKTHIQQKDETGQNLKSASSNLHETLENMAKALKAAENMTFQLPDRYYKRGSLQSVSKREPRVLSRNKKDATDYCKGDSKDTVEGPLGENLEENVFCSNLVYIDGLPYIQIEKVEDVPKRACFIPTKEVIPVHQAEVICSRPEQSQVTSADKLSHTTLASENSDGAESFIQNKMVTNVVGESEFQPTQEKTDPTEKLLKKTKSFNITEPEPVAISDIVLNVQEPDVSDSLGVVNISESPENSISKEKRKDVLLKLDGKENILLTSDIPLPTTVDAQRVYKEVEKKIAKLEKHVGRVSDSAISSDFTDGESSAFSPKGSRIFEPDRLAKNILFATGALNQSQYELATYTVAMGAADDTMFSTQDNQREGHEFTTASSDIPTQVSGIDADSLYLSMFNSSQRDFISPRTPEAALDSSVFLSGDSGIGTSTGLVKTTQQGAMEETKTKNLKTGSSHPDATHQVSPTFVLHPLLTGAVHLDEGLERDGNISLNSKFQSRETKGSEEQESNSQGKPLPTSDSHQGQIQPNSGQKDGNSLNDKDENSKIKKNGNEMERYTGPHRKKDHYTKAMIDTPTNDKKVGRQRPRNSSSLGVDTESICSLQDSIQITDEDPVFETNEQITISGVDPCNKFMPEWFLKPTGELTTNKFFSVFSSEEENVSFSSDSDEDKRQSNISSHAPHLIHDLIQHGRVFTTQTIDHGIDPQRSQIYTGSTLREQNIRENNLNEETHFSQTRHLASPNLTAGYNSRVQIEAQRPVIKNNEYQASRPSTVVSHEPGSILTSLRDFMRVGDQADVDYQMETQQRLLMDQTRNSKDMSSTSTNSPIRSDLQTPDRILITSPTESYFGVKDGSSEYETQPDHHLHRTDKNAFSYNRRSVKFNPHVQTNMPCDSDHQDSDQEWISSYRPQTNVPSDWRTSSSRNSQLGITGHTGVSTNNNNWVSPTPSDSYRHKPRHAGAYDKTDTQTDTASVSEFSANIGDNSHMESYESGSVLKSLQDFMEQGDQRFQTTAEGNEYKQSSPRGILRTQAEIEHTIPKAPMHPHSNTHSYLWTSTTTQDPKPSSTPEKILERSYQATDEEWVSMHRQQKAFPDEWVTSSSKLVEQKVKGKPVVHDNPPNQLPHSTTFGSSLPIDKKYDNKAPDAFDKQDYDEDWICANRPQRHMPNDWTTVSSKSVHHGIVRKHEPYYVYDLPDRTHNQDYTAEHPNEWTTSVDGDRSVTENKDPHDVKFGHGNRHQRTSSNSKGSFQPSDKAHNQHFNTPMAKMSKETETYRQQTDSQMGINSSYYQSEVPVIDVSASKKHTSAFGMQSTSEQMTPSQMAFSHSGDSQQIKSNTHSREYSTEPVRTNSNTTQRRRQRAMRHTIESSSSDSEPELKRQRAPRQYFSYHDSDSDPELDRVQQAIRIAMILGGSSYEGQSHREDIRIDSPRLLCSPPTGLLRLVPLFDINHDHFNRSPSHTPDNISLQRPIPHSVYQPVPNRADVLNNTNENIQGPKNTEQYRQRTTTNVPEAFVPDNWHTNSSQLLSEKVKSRYGQSSSDQQDLRNNKNHQVPYGSYKGDGQAERLLIDTPSQSVGIQGDSDHQDSDQEWISQYRPQTDVPVDWRTSSVREPHLDIGRNYTFPGGNHWISTNNAIKQETTYKQNPPSGFHPYSANIRNLNNRNESAHYSDRQHDQRDRFLHNRNSNKHLPHGNKTESDHQDTNQEWILRHRPQTEVPTDWITSSSNNPQLGITGKTGVLPDANKRIIPETLQNHDEDDRYSSSGQRDVYSHSDKRKNTSANNKPTDYSDRHVENSYESFPHDRRSESLVPHPDTKGNQFNDNGFDRQKNKSNKSFPSNGKDPDGQKRNSDHQDSDQEWVSRYRPQTDVPTDWRTLSSNDPQLGIIGRTGVSPDDSNLPTHVSTTDPQKQHNAYGMPATTIDGGAHPGITANSFYPDNYSDKYRSVPSNRRREEYDSHGHKRYADDQDSDQDWVSRYRPQADVPTDWRTASSNNPQLGTIGRTGVSPDYTNLSTPGGTKVPETHHNAHGPPVTQPGTRVNSSYPNNDSDKDQSVPSTRRGDEYNPHGNRSDPDHQDSDQEWVSKYRPQTDVPTDWRTSSSNDPQLGILGRTGVSPNETKLLPFDVTKDPEAHNKAFGSPLPTRDFDSQPGTQGNSSNPNNYSDKDRFVPSTRRGDQYNPHGNRSDSDHQDSDQEWVSKYRPQTDVPSDWKTSSSNDPQLGILGRTGVSPNETNMLPSDVTKDPAAHYNAFGSPLSTGDFDTQPGVRGNSSYPNNYSDKDQSVPSTRRGDEYNPHGNRSDPDHQDSDQEWVSKYRPQTDVPSDWRTSSSNDPQLDVIGRTRVFPDALPSDITKQPGTRHNTNYGLPTALRYPGTRGNSSDPNNDSDKDQSLPPNRRGDQHNPHQNRSNSDQDSDQEWVSKYRPQTDVPTDWRTSSSNDPQLGILGRTGVSPNETNLLPSDVTKDPAAHYNAFGSPLSTGDFDTKPGVRGNSSYPNNYSDKDQSAPPNRRGDQYNPHESRSNSDHQDSDQEWVSKYRPQTDVPTVWRTSSSNDPQLGITGRTGVSPDENHLLPSKVIKDPEAHVNLPTRDFDTQPGTHGNSSYPNNYSDKDQSVPSNKRGDQYNPHGNRSDPDHQDSDQDWVSKYRPQTDVPTDWRTSSSNDPQLGITGRTGVSPDETHLLPSKVIKDPEAHYNAFGSPLSTGDFDTQPGVRGNSSYPNNYSDKDQSVPSEVTKDPEASNRRRDEENNPLGNRSDSDHQDSDQDWVSKYRPQTDVPTDWRTSSSNDPQLGILGRTGVSPNETNLLPSEVTKDPEAHYNAFGSPLPTTNFDKQHGTQGNSSYPNNYSDKDQSVPSNKRGDEYNPHGNCSDPDHQDSDQEWVSKYRPQTDVPTDWRTSSSNDPQVGITGRTGVSPSETHLLPSEVIKDPEVHYNAFGSPLSTGDFDSQPGTQGNSSYPNNYYDKDQSVPSNRRGDQYNPHGNRSDPDHQDSDQEWVSKYRPQTDVPTDWRTSSSNDPQVGITGRTGVSPSETHLLPSEVIKDPEVHYNAFGSPLSTRDFDSQPGTQGNSSYPNNYSDKDQSVSSNRRGDEYNPHGNRSDSDHQDSDQDWVSKYRPQTDVPTDWRTSSSNDPQLGITGRTGMFPDALPPDITKEPGTHHNTYGLPTALRYPGTKGNSSDPNNDSDKDQSVPLNRRGDEYNPHENRSDSEPQDSDQEWVSKYRPQTDVPADWRTSSSNDPQLGILGRTGVSPNETNMLPSDVTKDPEAHYNAFGSPLPTRDFDTQPGTQGNSSDPNNDSDKDQSVPSTRRGDEYNPHKNRSDPDHQDSDQEWVSKYRPQTDVPTDWRTSSSNDRQLGITGRTGISPDDTIQLPTSPETQNSADGPEANTKGNLTYNSKPDKYANEPFLSKTRGNKDDRHLQKSDSDHQDSDQEWISRNRPQTDLPVDWKSLSSTDPDSRVVGRATVTPDGFDKANKSSEIPYHQRSQEPYNESTCESDDENSDEDVPQKTSPYSNKPLPYSGKESPFEKDLPGSDNDPAEGNQGHGLHLPTDKAYDIEGKQFSSDSSDHQDSDQEWISKNRPQKDLPDDWTASSSHLLSKGIKGKTGVLLDDMSDEADDYGDESQLKDEIMNVKSPVRTDEPESDSSPTCDASEGSSEYSDHQDSDQEWVAKQRGLNQVPDDWGTTSSHLLSQDVKGKTGVTADDLSSNENVLPEDNDSESTIVQSDQELSSVDDQLSSTDEDIQEKDADWIMQNRLSDAIVEPWQTNSSQLLKEDVIGKTGVLQKNSKESVYEDPFDTNLSSESDNQMSDHDWISQNRPIQELPDWVTQSSQALGKSVTGKTGVEVPEENFDETDKQLSLPTTDSQPEDNDMDDRSMSNDSITWVFIGRPNQVDQAVQTEGSYHSSDSVSADNESESGEPPLRHRYGIDDSMLPLSEKTVSDDNLPKLVREQHGRRHSSCDILSVLGSPPIGIENIFPSKPSDEEITRYRDTPFKYSAVDGGIGSTEELDNQDSEDQLPSTTQNLFYDSNQPDESGDELVKVVTRAVYPNSQNQSGRGNSAFLMEDIPALPEELETKDAKVGPDRRKKRKHQLIVKQVDKSTATKNQPKAISRAIQAEEVKEISLKEYHVTDTQTDDPNWDNITNLMSQTNDLIRSLSDRIPDADSLITPITVPRLESQPTIVRLTDTSIQTSDNEEDCNKSTDKINTSIDSSTQTVLNESTQTDIVEACLSATQTTLTDAVQTSDNEEDFNKSTDQINTSVDSSTQTVLNESTQTDIVEACLSATQTTLTDTASTAVQTQVENDADPPTLDSTIDMSVQTDEGIEIFSPNSSLNLTEPYVPSLLIEDVPDLDISTDLQSLKDEHERMLLLLNRSRSAREARKEALRKRNRNFPLPLVEESSVQPISVPSQDRLTSDITEWPEIPTFASHVPQVTHQNRVQKHKERDIKIINQIEKDKEIHVMLDVNSTPDSTPTASGSLCDNSRNNPGRQVILDRTTTTKVMKRDGEYEMDKQILEHRPSGDIAGPISVQLIEQTSQPSSQYDNALLIPIQGVSDNPNKTRDIKIQSSGHPKSFTPEGHTVIPISTVSPPLSKSVNSPSRSIKTSVKISSDNPLRGQLLSSFEESADLSSLYSERSLDDSENALKIKLIVNSNNSSTNPGSISSETTDGVNISNKNVTSQNDSTLSETLVSNQGKNAANKLNQSNIHQNSQKKIVKYPSANTNESSEKINKSQCTLTESENKGRFNRNRSIKDILNSSDEFTQTDFVNEANMQSELERLQQERVEILDLMSLNYLPPSLTIELLEAKLNYCIGQTDLLLTVVEENWDTEEAEGAAMSQLERQQGILSEDYITCYKENLAQSKKTIANCIDKIERSQGRGRGRTRTRSRNLMQMRRNAELEAFTLERMREQNDFGRTRSLSPLKNAYLKSPRHLGDTDLAAASSESSLTASQVMSPREHKDYLIGLRKKLVKTVVDEDSRSVSPDTYWTPRSLNSSFRSSSIPDYSSSREVSPEFRASDYLYNFDGPSASSISPDGRRSHEVYRNAIHSLRGQIYAQSGVIRSVYDMPRVRYTHLASSPERLLEEYQQTRKRTSSEISRAREAIKPWTRQTIRTDDSGCSSMDYQSQLVMPKSHVSPSPSRISKRAVDEELEKMIQEYAHNNSFSSSNSVSSVRRAESHSSSRSCRGSSLPSQPSRLMLENRPSSERHYPSARAISSSRERPRSSYASFQSENVNSGYSTISKRSTFEPKLASHKRRSRSTIPSTHSTLPPTLESSLNSERRRVLPSNHEKFTYSKTRPITSSDIKSKLNSNVNS